MNQILDLIRGEEGNSVRNKGDIVSPGLEYGLSYRDKWIRFYRMREVKVWSRGLDSGTLV